MAADIKFILTVDGGGIRGLIPALVLRDLEARIAAERQARNLPPKPLHQCFDLMGGTSTGGIIVAGLAAPSAADPRRAACTPADLVDLYADHGRTIFPELWLKTLRSLWGPLYSAQPLDRLLEERLGEARLSAALTNVVLCAYDTKERRALFMAGGQGFGAKEPDFLAREAARGSSAAPTFFPPAKVAALTASTAPHTLIDGGVFANDPSMATYVEALKLGWSNQRIEMLSLGTGSQNRPYPYHQIADWGILRWLIYRGDHPLISILMQGVSSTTAYQMNQLLNRDQDDRCYTRIDGALHGVSDELDDASPTNIAALRGLAARWIEQHDDDLNGWAKRLAERP